MRYEPTSVCSTFGRRRACRATARSPLSARLYRAPLSDSAPQRPGAAPFPDRCCPELRCPNCPRRSAGFCPPRLGWPSATVQNAQNHPCRLVSRPRRRPAPLLHQSPRLFGKPTSLWTLPLTAQVCYEKGWTLRRLSGESIRLVLKRLGVGWKRAKHWLVSPDPEYAQKKTARPADRAGRVPPGLGAGLPGRDVVDPPGPTQRVCLDRGATAAPCCPTSVAAARRRWPVTACCVPIAGR